MANGVGKFFKDLFTESDGETWDLGRVQGTIAFAVYLSVSFWAYSVQGQKFDGQNFGVGLAAVMVGYGGMVMLKDKERPK